MAITNSFSLLWFDAIHNNISRGPVYVFLAGYVVSSIIAIVVYLFYKLGNKKNIKVPNLPGVISLIFIALGMVLLLFAPREIYPGGSVCIVGGLVVFFTSNCITLLNYSSRKKSAKIPGVFAVVLGVITLGMLAANRVPANMTVGVFTGLLFILTLVCSLDFLKTPGNDRTVFLLFALELAALECSIFSSNIITGLFFMTAGFFFWALCCADMYKNDGEETTVPAGVFPEPDDKIVQEEVASFIPDKDFADTTESYDGLQQRVSRILNPFVPPEFLNILNKKSVAELKLGDHAKQEMTIFFSDIRQFTDLSERLTPEESFKFINSYLSRIVPVIQEHKGFVDKYIGDAILALYHHDGGADSAVRTAIDIQRTIAEYNGHRMSVGYRPLSMGIGIHTGPLMIGVVGIEKRMQNTVISDAVNLASRLESITKVFNISLAISEETFKKLEDPGSYMYRFIGKVRVKGKVDPVSVFEIFDGINEREMEQKMKANIYFEQGMINYYQKNMMDAVNSFKKVLEILPQDGATVFYLENCMAKIHK